MVQQPDQYSWSSHHAYTGEQFIQWLTTDWVLDQLGTEHDVAISNYLIFISDGLDEGHRKDWLF